LNRIDAKESLILAHQKTEQRETSAAKSGGKKYYPNTKRWIPSSNAIGNKARANAVGYIGVWKNKGFGCGRYHWQCGLQGCNGLTSLWDMCEENQSLIFGQVITSSNYKQDTLNYFDEKIRDNTIPLELIKKFHLDVDQKELETAEWYAKNGGCAVTVDKYGERPPQEDEVVPD